MVSDEKYGSRLTENSEIIYMPYKIKILNLLGLRNFLVNQPNIEAERISQVNMKAKEINQPDMKVNLVHQPEIEADEINQPNMQAKEVNQWKMKAKKVYQPNMQAEEVSQARVEAGIIYQQDMKAKKVYQEGMEIDELITGEKSCYGDWNLKEAKINKWTGDWVYFDKINMKDARLPSELINVIEAQKVLMDMAESYRMIK
ncbi:MAG: hypothetical protein KAU95_01230 [Candidatus Aenigmarchaeota archaeon]|nr:hypothetical protein [Candidatus Aenigmarchaeota archaeon]